MTTSGIIRRIDELGRIVIPKEIRKSLRIKNGDSLEILVEGDNITLRKYSQVENLENIANLYAASFNQVLKYKVGSQNLYLKSESGCLANVSDEA